MQGRLVSLGYWALVLATVLGSFYVHRQAGLTLPNPWNDEAWNLFPAKAFVETGSFVAPELNPDRPTVLYGGGYAVAIGLFMRATGFSLEAARGFSWVCMAGVWLLTALMLRRLPWKIPLAAIAGLYFLASAHVVAGNVARPDAFMLLIATLGYWFLMNDRPIPAVFLCGLGVIVHPNALYFLAGAVGYTASSPALRRRLWPPTRGDRIAMVLCLIPVLLSAGLIWSIWEWFHADFLVAALSANLAYDPLDKLADFRGWLALMGGLFLAARLQRLPSAVWMLYGLAALLVSLMGGEMWYEVFKATGFMVMITGGTAILWQTARSNGRRLSARLLPGGRSAYIDAVTGGLALLYLLGLLHMNYRHGFVPGPRNYPQKLTWGWGMAMASPEIPYLTQADLERVVDLALAAAGDHAEPIIEFPATGDSVLFAPALPLPARPLLRIRTDAESHVVVFHLSRYIPPWVQKGILRRMEEWNISESDPDYVRDDTEKWYVRTVPAPSGAKGKP
jgi:hypothetical protein